jgi:hypothetical protein
MSPGNGGAGAAPGAAGVRGRLRRSGVRPFRPGAPQTLRSLYQRYCDTEAGELLALLPREGLRALWKRARERDAATVGEAGDRRAGQPPPEALALLRAEARAVLPLPPYEIWMEAYLAQRAPFLERMEIASAPEAVGPVTVAVRPVNAVWWAHLNLERRELGWVGHLAFHAGADAGPVGKPVAPGAGGGGLRTVDIFRGDTPDDIRERFRELTGHTLEAFLRSVSPQEA